ncbi:MAG: hypothetical protein HY432_03000 [Candidatus Liptonbacteria bacterium]|nr:hypothetical protein [Candidatus Liptonbacteria bacterium]
MGYIGAAFGLVAGLAWNDAIKALIEYLFPFSQTTILAKFLYAALITIVVVIILQYLEKFLNPEEPEE